jgi:putative flippase GtrA
MSLPELVRRRVPSREVLTFLAVGGVGYVVDVAAFNVLRSTSGFASADPSYAKALAVAVAMVVTYVGNRLFTWRGQGSDNRRREVTLFVLFNVIGLGFSVLTLFISHDLMALTSRLADNISANVVGLALGTGFRYWSYRRFVFVDHLTGGRGAPPRRGRTDRRVPPSVRRRPGATRWPALPPADLTRR